MKTRVLTALALLPVVLGVLLAQSPWPTAVLATLVAYLGMRELTYLVSKGKSNVAIPSPFMMAGTAIIAFQPTPEVLRFVLVFASLMTLGGVIALLKLAKGVRALPLRGLASGWLMGPLLAMVALQAGGVGTPLGSAFALNLVLMLVLPIWAGDTAAIFVGKAWGKRPLAPQISPNKTWEGAIGSLVASVVVAAAAGSFLGIGWGLGVACGVLAGVLGQLGDLLESALKRSSGLKDSGSLLPGHGGILDRIDSLLLAAPFVAALLLLTRSAG